MSKGEDALYEILQDEFPFHPITRQYPIKIGKTTLFLDFYLKRLKLAFEVDGVQHDTKSSFFHKTKYDLSDSKHRDSLKEQWCSTNGVTLIHLKDREVNITNLRDKIKQAKDQRNNKSTASRV